MRIVVAPLNYSHRQRGQVEAFQKVFGADNVHEIDWLKLHRQGYDGGEQVFGEVQRFKPDWLWLQVQGSEEFNPRWISVIRERVPRCLVTHWMGDCRPAIAPNLWALCRAANATLISSVGQIPLFQQTGAKRVEYVQIGLDPEDIGNGPEWAPPFRVPDVVFCGGYYGHVQEFADGTHERVSAIRRLASEGIDVGVVGPGWPSDITVVGSCTTKQSHHVYKRAKVALAINHFNNIERYYSDRLLIAMASGTPTVARYVPGLEQEFSHREHCLMWTTEDEMIARVLMALNHKTMMGERAREFVSREHTWEARIRALVPKIEAWRAEDCHE